MFKDATSKGKMKFAGIFLDKKGGGGGGEISNWPVRPFSRGTKSKAEVLGRKERERGRARQHFIVT